MDQMLKGGVIEQARSKWARPVVFAGKKDGKMRFCVDCRMLTAVTVLETYLLPRIDERINSLDDATTFLQLAAAVDAGRLR